MSGPARMHPADLERLADLVVDRLAARLLSAPEVVSLGVGPSAGVATPERLREAAPALLDAKEVAARFGVTAGWVRENADRLGVIRLGDGSKPRMRFDPEKVASAVTGRSASGESDASASPDRAADPGSRGAAVAGSALDSLPVRELQPRPTSRKAAPRRANARGLTERDVSSPPPKRTPAGTRSSAPARLSRKET